VHDDDPAGVARSSKTMQLGAEAPKQELSHLLTNPAMLFSIFSVHQVSPELMPDEGWQGRAPQRRVVRQPAHTLGLKRVVARKRAALFTDLP
jgi:hypothetical protein